MALHLKSEDVEGFKRRIGYKGCKNCEFQIAPLRMCEWAEKGGDGRLHVICPRWKKEDKA